MTIMEGSCCCAAKPLGVLPLQLALPYPEPGGGLGRALAERLLHTGGHSQCSLPGDVGLFANPGLGNSLSGQSCPLKD